MGWLIALAVLIFLAALPLGVSVKYDSGGTLLRLILGPLRITLLPSKKKRKPEKVDNQNKTRVKAQNQQTQSKTTAPGKLTDFMPLVKTAVNFLGDLRRKLRVDVLEVKLIMAGDDPCDLATNYGRAWTALGSLWPVLERVFVIKKRNVQLECDFTAEEMYIFMRLDLTMTLGRLIALVVRYGVRALKEYLNIMKIRKGGAAS